MSDATARAVVEALARHVSEGDGGGLINSSLDAAAMELATSRHAVALRQALIAEYRQRDFWSRSSAGSLAAMVMVVRVPEDEPVIQPMLAWLISDIQDESAAIELALRVMIWAWQRRDCRIPGLTDRLLSMLTVSPAAANAGAWGLGWMNDERHGDRAWRPTPADLDQLLAYISSPVADPEAAFWVGRILGRSGDVRAIEPLVAALSAPTRLREAAIEALGRIGDARAVEPLLARLEDADENTRRAVVGGLARAFCKDETDRRLLSLHLDAVTPFLDPSAAISEKQVERAAEQFKLPPEEVRRRYEALAPRFHLRLTWQQ